MPSPSDELHIRVELPSSTNHTSTWDSLHAFNQVTKSSLLSHSASEWIRQRDSILVSVAAANSNGISDTDHEVLLSHKLLVSQQAAHRLTQHTCGSDLSLEASDAEVDNEQPQSSTGNFVDDHSEYNCNNFDSVAGDCAMIKAHATKNADSDGVAVLPSLTRPTTIRFRSRVRITSGLNRHRRSIHSSVAGAESRTSTPRLPSDETGYFYYTPSSSISGSPSSSISAPLRSRTDDEADRPGWGPLGQRVNMFAKKKRLRRKFDDDQSWSKRNSAEGLTAPRGRMTETSPLLTGASHGKSLPRERHQGWCWRRCYCAECGGVPSGRKLSLEEVDQAFGAWPNRLLNYQWWWWQAEGVICCQCLDETDDEYF